MTNMALLHFVPKDSGRNRVTDDESVRDLLIATLRMKMGFVDAPLDTGHFTQWCF